VTVNISALQLQRPDFVHTVLGVLGDTGLPPESLVLELTETVLLATSKAETRTLTGRLEELRRRGVRIALDDFGTGYSSLAYLRYLPIDLVKIDQSFMQSDDDVARQGQAFTRAILDLCRILRVRAVAEGVETPAQHDFLRTLGCPLGQGYLYGAPMPREDFERLLSWRPAVAVAIEAGAGAGSGSGVSATPVAGASAGNSVVAATATSSVALSPHVSSSSSLSSSSAVAPGAAATPGGERDHPG
jgi:predicted signal transduction protein with EAL and GGDEF domain